MPLEFDDVSKQVTQGADGVSKSLDGIVNAAENADVVMQDLSKTQEASIKICEQFSKCLDGSRKGLASVARVSAAAASGIGLVAQASKGAEVDLSSAVRSLADISEGFEKVDKGSAKTKKSVTSAAKMISKQIDALKKDIKTLEGQLDNVADPKIVDLKVQVAGLEELKSSISVLDEQEAAMFDSEVAAKGLGKAMAALAKRNSDLEQRMLDAGLAAKEQATQAKMLQNEMGKLEKVTDIVKSRFIEGRQEAENFAGGLGLTNGAMIGAGVGAFFLFQKLGDLANRFKDVAVNLARFNVETAAAQRVVLGFAGEALDTLRKDLNLTREQAEAFFSVVRQGTNEVGLTAAEIEKAASAIQKTFGGDPTKRLQEFVDLLKEIPTLEADLDITASLDKQAAAIFAVAQAGKIETVIDLQAAGLLGGRAIELAPEDVELLDAQQKTAATVEDVQDFLVNRMFPAWGPQFAAIADGTFKGVALLGGAVAILGASRVFLGKAQKRTTAAVKDVERAIWNTSALRGRTMPTGRDAQRVRFSPRELLTGMKRIFAGLRRGGVRGATQAGLRQFGGPTAAKAFQRGGFSGLTRALTGSAKAATVTTKSLAVMAKVVKAATGPVAIAGAVLIGAGVAAEFLARKMEDSGATFGAAVGRVTGDLLKFAGVVATFAAIGSIFGPVGTAVGALVGTVVGVIGGLEGFGENVSDLGTELKATVKISDSLAKELGMTTTEIQRFGPAALEFGTFLEAFGQELARTGKVIKEGLVTAGKLAFDFGRQLFLTTTPIGLTIKGFQALTQASEEYRAVLVKLAPITGNINASLGSVSLQSELFGAALAENVKRTALSGLALQKELKLTEAAFKTGRFALVNFESEIAGVTLDALVSAGSDASAFSAALEQSARSVTDKFRIAGEELERRRKEIAENTQLEGAQRRQAQLDLQREQMKAAKDFVDGIRSVVGQFMQSPKILEAGLKAELERLELDADLEVGAVAGADIFKSVESQITTLGSRLQDALEAETKGRAKIAEAQREFGEKGAEATEVANRALGQLSKVQIDSLRAQGALVEDINGKLRIVEGRAPDVLKAVQQEFTNLSNQLTELTKDLPSAPVADLAKRLVDSQKDIDGATKELERLSKTVEKARTRFAKAGKGREELEKAEEELVNLQRKRLKAQAAATDAQQEIVKQIERARAVAMKAANLSKEEKKAIEELNINESAILVISKALAEGRDLQSKEILKEIGAGEEVANLLNALAVVQSQNARATEKRRQLIAQQTKFADIEAEINEAISVLTGTTASLEAYKALVGDRIKIEKELGDALNLINKITRSAEIVAAQRQLDTLQEAQAIASLTGNAIEATTAVIAGQIDLFVEQEKQTAEALKLARATLSGAKDSAKARADELREAEIAAKDGDEASKKRLEEAQRYARTANRQLKAAEQAVSNLEKSRKDILDSLGKVGDSITQGLDALNESLVGQRFEAELELGDTLGEFAEFSNDFEKIARQSTKIAISAARRRAELQRKTVESSLERERERVEAVAAVEERRKGPAAAALTRAEGMATLEAKKRTEFAKIELRQKQAVVAAAQREADLKTEAIDLDVEAIEAQQDFLGEFGGNIRVILGLQNQAVVLEREKLAIAEDIRDQMIAEGIGGLQLRRQEQKVIMQQLKVRRQELGIQKDIFEKILGKAFGEIRGAVGARRGRTSAAALLGVEGSRVMLLGGMFAAGGRAGTIEQRQAQRALAGFGERGAEQAGAIQTIADTSLESLPVEEKMARLMESSDGSLKGILVNTAAIVKGLGRDAVVRSEEAAVIANEVAKTGGTVFGNVAAKTATKAVGATGVSGEISAEAKLAAQQLQEMQNPLAGASQAFTEQRMAAEQAAKQTTDTTTAESRMEAFRQKHFRRLKLEGRPEGIIGIGESGVVPGKRMMVRGREIYEKAVATKMAEKAANEAFFAGRPETGAIAAATTGAQTAALAEQQRMGALEAAEAARPGFGFAGAFAGGEVEEAGRGEVAPFQIRGHLQVSFDKQMATLVAEVINTTEVRKSLEQAGVLYKK